jgi:hypothetical protein
MCMRMRVFSLVYSNEQVWDVFHHANTSLDASINYGSFVACI